MELIRPFFDGIGFQEIPHDHEMRYYCPCTFDRVRRALTTLGTTELQEMIDEGETSAITCQVCGRGYQISVEDLKQIHEDLRKNSMH